MKRFPLIIIQLIIISPYSWSAFNFRELDFWMERNPAELTESHKMEVITSYSQIYAVKELNAAGIGFLFANPLGHSSIGMTQFGSSLYRERKLILSHGYKMSNYLSLGLNIKGMFLNIQDFGEDSAFQWDGSFNLRLNQKMVFSTTLWNLNRASLSNGSVHLPTGLESKISKNFFSKLILALAILRTDPEPYALETELSFPLHNSITLKASYKDRPAKFLGGFSIHFPSILLDYRYHQNTDLPAFHQVNLTWKLKE